MVRRRRTCKNGHRFSSWESTRFPLVRKRDDSLVEFDSQKLRNGILAASASLPEGALGESTPDEVANEIVTDVVSLATTTPERDEEAMSTLDIGNRVLEGLLLHDSTGIAHWRFASVFFKDRGYAGVEELSEAINSARSQPPIWVVKARDVHSDESNLARTEPFSYNKLRRSLELAFTKSSRHRGIVETLLETISQEVRERAQPVPADLDAEPGPRPDRLEISTSEIGEIVLRHLRPRKFAFARFLSVYKDYESFDSFVAEIAQLAKEKAE